MCNTSLGMGRGVYDGEFIALVLIATPFSFGSVRDSCINTQLGGSPSNLRKLSPDHAAPEAEEPTKPAHWDETHAMTLSATGDSSGHGRRRRNAPAGPGSSAGLVCCGFEDAAPEADGPAKLTGGTTS